MYRTLTILCLFILSLASVSYGQPGLGSITGKVTDAQGGSITGAKVTAISKEKGTKTETVTNDQGIYQISQLIPGIYTLEIEAPNFKKLQQSDIKVQVADKLEINHSLEAGGVTETVNVNADTPLLRTQDPQTGEIIDQTMIQNLPQLNRDPLQLLRLAGNVQGGGGRAEGGSDTRINGGRALGIEYFVDGIAQSSGRAHNVSDVTPTTEAVQEFKVVTNGLSAEYGRISGGAVELVTRSGSNAFHGQLFTYVKDDALNANSWNQNRLGGKRTAFGEFFFGGAVGGPIILPRFGEGGPATYNGKNRSFFFFNYEGFRWNQSGRLETRSLPTLEERRGDFSNTIINGIRPLMYDWRGRVLPNAAGVIGPGSERLDLLGGDGRHVPADRISPVSRAVLDLLPLPNRTAPSNNSRFENYVGTVSEQRQHDQFAFRLDHNFTDNSRIFGRFAHHNGKSDTTRLLPTDLAPFREVDGAFSTTVNYDWIISPTLSLNARVGGHYTPSIDARIMDPNFDPSSIPFDPITRSLLTPGSPPWIVAATLPNFTDNPRRNVENSTTYNAAVSMIKVLNNHTLKFGYERRQYYDNYSNAGEGGFVFRQAAVSRYVGDDSGWNDQETANVLGTFLQGINSWAWIRAPRTRSMNTNYHGAYIQNDWKINQKLTLNLGVRWDLETPTSERYDKLYFWDPNAPSPFTIKPGWTWEGALTRAGIDPATVRKPEWVTQGLPKGAIRIANTKEHPSRVGQEYHPWQFSPRFGFAYSWNEKTVVRGSFGKMYLSTTGDPNGYSTGNGRIALSSAADAGWHNGRDTNYTDAISTWDRPFLPRHVIEYTRDNRLANFQATGGDPAAAAYNLEMRQPYEYVWNLGIQRELPNGFLLEANYSANLGRDLLAPDLISRFPRELFVPQNSTLYTREVETPFLNDGKYQVNYGDTMKLGLLQYSYPYFGPLQVLGSNIGISNYHSLNLRAERRLGRSFAFLVNYTLSKLLDNVGGPNADGGAIANNGGTGGRNYQSIDTIRNNYGISPLDERHRLSIYYNLNLPFGRGRQFLRDPQGFGGKLLDYVVGGWELAGISQWRSGRPVIISPTNINNDIRVETTFWKFATNNRDLRNPRFTDKKGAFISGEDLSRVRSRDSNLIGADLGGVFRDPENFILPPGRFVYGDLHVYPGIRHPSSFNHDLSLMKRFPLFSSEGTRYLQFRMEAENVFNMRGFGNYDTNPSNPSFGLITGPRYGERRIQVSARIIF